MKNLLIIILTSILFIPAFAQRQVIDGIEISNDQHWKGTIVIRGDVTITPTGRLTIDSGTKILFEPNVDKKKSGTDKTRSGIIVRGTLVAKGKISEKIVFTSAAESKRMNDWYGIEFLHVKSQSIIDYCMIEYAFNGIVIKNSKIQVSNSIIRYNFNSGILVETKSNPKIINNFISENDYAGIICRIGAEPILTNNLVTLNRFGVVILDISSVNMGSLNKDDKYNPGNNKILNNEEYNVYNHSSNNILAENNAWGSTSIAVISDNHYDRKDDGKYGEIDFRPFLRRYSLSQYDNLLRGINPQQRRAQTTASTAPIEAAIPESEEESISQEEPVTETTRGVEAKPSIAVPIKTEKQKTSAQTIAAVGKKEKNSKSTTSSQSSPVSDQVKQTETSIKAQEEKVLAAATTTELENKDFQTDVQPTVEEIDDDRVLLELFLDGGKKNVIKKVQPAIKGIVRNFIQAGFIRIEVIVAKDGSVESARILKGVNKVLDNAALEAAKQFKYQPGLKEGKPVRFQTMEVFRFK